jgi:hypothetical protein
MVYLQTKNPNFGIHTLEGLGIDKFCILDGHLVYFVAIWYIFAIWFVAPRIIWQTWFSPSSGNMSGEQSLCDTQYLVALFIIRYEKSLGQTGKDGGRDKKAYPIHHNKNIHM